MSKKNVRNKNDVENNIFHRAEGVEEIYHGWWGMPEYEHGEYVYSMAEFHFPDDESIQDFAEKTGLQITEKTKALWYPDIPYARDSEYKWTGE